MHTEAEAGPSAYKIADGFAQKHRAAAAQLFWDAFRDKLRPVMQPETKALAFLEAVIDPSQAISAISSEDRLVGIAGFKTSKGSFVGGDLRELRAIY